MAGRKRRKIQKKSQITKVVRERVEILLSLAQKTAKEKPQRARRYIKLARRLGEKYRIRFQRLQKMQFCKKCNAPFIPGFNVRVGFDLKRHQILYKCKGCGAEIKFPYKKKRKKEKRKTNLKK